METTTLTTLSDRFIDAFGSQRYDDLAALMTPDAHFRALLPPRTLDGGPELLIGCYHQWFGQNATVASAGSEPAGEKISLSYSVIVDDERQAEQHLYLSLTDDRISAIDLICSGFHAVSPR